MKSILFKGKALCTYYCRNGTNTIYVNVSNCLFKVFYRILFMKQRKKIFLSAPVAIFLKLTDKDRFLFVFNSFLNFVNHDICDMSLKLFISVKWDEINFEEELTVS